MSCIWRTSWSWFTYTPLETYHEKWIYILVAAQVENKWCWSLMKESLFLCNKKKRYDSWEDSYISWQETVHHQSLLDWLQRDIIKDTLNEKVMSCVCDINGQTETHFTLSFLWHWYRWWPLFFPESHEERCREHLLLFSYLSSRFRSNASVMKISVETVLMIVMVLQVINFIFPFHCYSIE